LGIYKKNPNGDNKEITSIYKKNPKTGQVAEVTSIYKSGKLIYSVTRPLWENASFQYIANGPQLSKDKSLLTYNFNVDANGVGFVSGIDTIDTITGEPQMFVPNLGYLIGNRYMTDDKTTIYAIDTNRNLLKMVGSNLTSTASESTVLPLDNVYVTGWKELFNNTSKAAVTVNNSPLLYSFQKTDGTTEIGVANLDGFSDKGAFPSMSSYLGTLGNLLFVPVDKFKIFKDENDYGKYGSAYGDILAFVGANSNYSSNKGNWGTLLRISKAGYAVSSSLVPVDTTVDVSFNSTSSSNTGYINSGMISPLGYYEDPTNSSIKHVEMVGPYQAWSNPFSSKMYDVRDNNIIIIDGLFDSTNNLWALGNLVSLDNSIASSNPNSNITHIKQEIGKVNSIAEDVDNYDKELKIGTSLATSSENEMVSYSNNSQTKVNTYAYHKPISGNIYASIQDGDVNNVKRFSVNGSNSNYWNQDTVTVGVFKSNGDIDTSGDYNISDFINVPGRSNTLRIELKTSQSHSYEIGYALYDSNNNIIGSPEFTNPDKLDDSPGSIIGYRTDVDLPKSCAKVRVSFLPVSDVTTLYPVVSFDGNVIYTTGKGYSVNSMIKSGHQLTMTINNNDNGWGKTITNGSRFTLASTLDENGNIYSARTDGASPYYYFRGYNSRDGNTNQVSSSYAAGATGDSTKLPWRNTMVWDKYNGRTVFVKDTVNYLFLGAPYISGSSLATFSVSGYYYNYNNAGYSLNPGFLINDVGYITMPNAYYLKQAGTGGNATTPISSAPTTTTLNSISQYNYVNSSVIWSYTLTNFNGSIQGIIYNKTYDGDVVWDSNGRIAMISDSGGKLIFQTDPIFPIHDNNIPASPLYPQNCCVLPNGNIISVKVDYSVATSATVYIYLINGSNGEVISSTTTSVTDNGTTNVVENRVLISNSGDTTVITTNNTSIKVTINSDNTIVTALWNNLIPASYNGTASDINVKVTSLSSNDTAIFAGTDNGMVFRYDLSSFGFSWVSRGFTNLSSNAIVTAYDNFVYATGTSTSANVGTYKILMNGNLYESSIKAMKV